MSDAPQPTAPQSPLNWGMTIASLIGVLGATGVGINAGSEAGRVAELQQAQNKENVAQMLAWNKALSDENKAIRADYTEREARLRERVAKLEAKIEVRP